jgi:hypothetical protein
MAKNPDAFALEGDPSEPLGPRVGARSERGNGHAQGTAAEGMLGQTERVRDDAERLLQHSGEALETLAALARNRLEARPYTTLLTAAGIGYVLGGGIPMRFVTLALGIGLRQVGLRTLDRLLAGNQLVPTDSGPHTP